MLTPENARDFAVILKAAEDKRLALTEAIDRDGKLATVICVVAADDGNVMMLVPYAVMVSEEEFAQFKAPEGTGPVVSPLGYKCADEREH